MASPNTLLELIVLSIWKCLHQPVTMHELCNQVFPSYDILFDIASGLNLSFAPGLLDVMQATVPPAIDFFKNLPSDAHGYWGIYVLVLFKWGFLPIIYIGSGTDIMTSVHARWVRYRNVKQLPRYVKAAVNDGYTIVHKGLLVWTPIPSAAAVPITRIFFVAMEAMFAFYFWAMYSTTADYGMGSCVVWERSNFTYRGSCSHNSLREGVLGDFDLTPEQLEAVAAESQQRMREYQNNWHRLDRIQNPEKNKARDAKNKAARKLKEPEKILEETRRSQAKAIASKKHHCDICQTTFAKAHEHERHNKTKLHLKREADFKAGKLFRSDHRCDVCGIECPSPSALEIHQKTPRHKKKVTVAAAAAAARQGPA